MKKMITLLFLLSGLYMQAQESKDTEKTNFYECGKPVVVMEDNFKNLFENFPKYVTNGGDVDFLSYKKVGEIKNKKQAKKYVEKNFKQGIFPNISNGFQQSNEVITSSITYFFSDLPYGIPNNQMKEMVNTIANEYIHVGDNVYEMKFVVHLKTYIHYVFVNPETKKVVLKGNLFGSDVPMRHIEYINSKN